MWHVEYSGRQGSSSVGSCSTASSCDASMIGSKEWLDQSPDADEDLGGAAVSTCLLEYTCVTPSPSLLLDLPASVGACEHG